MGNLSTDTTRKDLIQLLGLRNTTFYGANVRTKLVSDTKYKYKRYALLEGPRYIMNTVLEGNGMEYRKRKLVIEIQKSDKSAIPYSTRDAQRGGINEDSRQTSGSKRDKGDDLHSTLPLGKRKAYLPSLGWKVNSGLKTQRW